MSGKPENGMKTGDLVWGETFWTRSRALLLVISGRRLPLAGTWPSTRMGRLASHTPDPGADYLRDAPDVAHGFVRSRSQRPGTTPVLCGSIRVDDSHCFKDHDTFIGRLSSGSGTFGKPLGRALGN